MSTNAHFHRLSWRSKTGLVLAIGLMTLLFAFPLICAERGGPSRNAAPRPAPVDRSSHGSIRHVDTHVVPRQVEQRPVEQRQVEQRREPERPVETHQERAPRGEIEAHHDVEADVHREHAWNSFAFGRRLAALPLGFLALHIGGVPYFYNDGVYYQPADGGYQEVYPPVGAAIPQPPDGAIAIEAGGQTYYYAGGGFYLQQADGTYAIAPTPIGVVVPELPPGAVQVSANGTVAYQFNGIYYEPVFVNGVTQYETFVP